MLTTEGKLPKTCNHNLLQRRNVAFLHDLFIVLARYAAATCVKQSPTSASLPRLLASRRAKAENLGLDE